MTRTIVALLRMSRPYYVIQAMAPVVAGYVTASQLGLSWPCVALVASVFGLLAMAAWSGNDFYDRSLDGRGRPKRLYGLYVAGGTGVSLTECLPARKVIPFVIGLVLVALSLAATISVPFLLIACGCTLVGLFYSLPPVRLKARGLAGALLTASSYGLVAFTAGWIAAGKEVPASAFVFGTVMSVLVFGYDGIGHLIDHMDDKANGLNTFVVQLGEARATKLLAACQVIPIVLVGVLGFAGNFNVNILYVSVLFVASTITAGLLLFGRRTQHLYAVRLISVPLLSAAFFLLV